MSPLYGLTIHSEHGTRNLEPPEIILRFPGVFLYQCRADDSQRRALEAVTGREDASEEEVEAARAALVDSGAKDVSKVSAMTKLYASDVAMEVTTNAVQVLGGYGYMKEYPVEKMMRDAKILQIYEGTNQIQRNVIGAALIKEYARKP